jgi:gamma-glutamyl hercynylcysteine S-oxide synthase
MLKLGICPIPAGTYPIGDADLVHSRPPHTVQLAAFVISQHTISNAQFHAFVHTGGYHEARWWTDMGWRWRISKDAEQPAFSADPFFGAAQLPVVGVCWYEAVAFARWAAHHDGLAWRLPSEAEWEAAARFAAINPVAANINHAGLRQGRAWPSGTGNVGSGGLADLLGNVWEWTSTRWGHNWQTEDYPYPYRPDDGREVQEGSGARVMRGGSWFDAPSESVPAARARYLAGSRGSNIGFRLAYSPTNVP